MKESVIIFLLGCIEFLLINDVVSQVGVTHNCKQFIEDGIQTANCRNQPNLKDIPQDLDRNTKKLILAVNRLSELDENQFNRYSNLEILIMNNMDASFNKSYYYVFRQLRKLKTLDLSHGQWRMGNGPRDAVFYWPPMLKNLTVYFSYEGDEFFLDLSNLEELERLDASQNNLQVFPTFHFMAPLKFLNLNSTNLIRMRAEDLASLCELEELHLSLYTKAELLSAEKYCECKRIQTWIKNYNIKGTKPSCEFRNESCDLNFSEELISIREKCLSRYNIPFLIKLFIVLIIILVIGIGGGIAGYFVWKKMKTEND